MNPKKILLAEDDADDRAFFFSFLKNREDIQLLPAVENGEEVLTFLTSAEEKESLPDLIILDQNMPKKNGLQTLSVLKSNSHYKDIPVFIYSTYADDNLRSRSLDSGAVSVLPKPMTPDGYHQMIDKVLQTLA